MKNIDIIQDGNQYHLTIGSADAWMSDTDLYRLMVEIGKLYGDDDQHPLRLRAWIDALEEIAEEYGGKTIENIIKQLNARVKEL